MERSVGANPAARRRFTAPRNWASVAKDATASRTPPWGVGFGSSAARSATRVRSGAWMRGGATRRAAVAETAFFAFGFDLGFARAAVLAAAFAGLLALDFAAFAIAR